MSNSPVFCGIPRAGRKRARDPQGRLAERREKGLWSFLTWSFFLSQVATMEQASAAEAQAGGSGDEQVSTSDPAGRPGREKCLPPPVEPAMLAEMREAGTAGDTTQEAWPRQATAPTAFLAGAPGERGRRDSSRIGRRILQATSADQCRARHRRPRRRSSRTRPGRPVVAPQCRHRWRAPRARIICRARAPRMSTLW